MTAGVGNTTAGVKIKKMDHVTLTTPLSGLSIVLRLRYNIVYLCTKFDDSSFSHSRDIIGGPKI